MKTQQLCQRLCSLGVPKQQRDEIISEIRKWVRCSGEEWTVERIKSLKLEFITGLTGKPVRAPYVKHNRSGHPSGVWSWLFSTPRLSLEQKLNVLMAYSVFKANALTEKQRTKFFGSMESPSTVGLNTKFKFTGPTYDVTRFVPYRKREDGNYSGFVLPFVANDEPHSTATAPNLLGQSVCKGDYFTHWLTAISSGPFHQFYLKYPLVFKSGVIPCRTMYDVAWDIDVTKQPMYGCVGKIAAIQEPGYKLRAVASPINIYQSLLKPLKLMLYWDLKNNCPGDCTHDQLLGVERVQNWLASGKTCYSVDMSDATNLFPLPTQIDLLRRRYTASTELHRSYLNQVISLFEEVSKGTWLYKEEDGSVSYHRFTRGQPLGLLPSFGSFALAHNILLEGICRLNGIEPNCYVICGDDIVISNDLVHSIYRKTLDNLGCKVSEGKCLTSNLVAEFAGCVITRNHVLHGYKWKGLNDQNFLAVAKQLGPRSLTMLRSRQRRVIKSIAPIPEYLGGLGWNPDGIPLSDRLSTPLAKALSDAKFSDPSESFWQYTSLSARIQQLERDWMEATRDPSYFGNRISGYRIEEDPFDSEAGLPVYREDGSLVGTTSTCDFGLWSNPLVKLSRESDLSGPESILLKDTRNVVPLREGVYLRRVPKEIYSPSRKTASDMLEATYKLEALQVDRSLWKDLRTTLKVATSRTTKVRTSNSLRRSDDSNPVPRITPRRPSSPKTKKRGPHL